MKSDTFETALNLAKSTTENYGGGGLVFDIVRYLKSLGEWDYYHISSTHFIGKKIGLPNIAKIHCFTHKIVFVEPLSVIMWAISSTPNQPYPKERY